MPIRRHGFTPTILDVLSDYTTADAEDILERSPLIQYLNIKTEAANRGSKARAAYGNHYAIYVLVEDYINKDFNVWGKYDRYDGARFSDLLKRQRELPFGSRLQNHALNHRLNEEFTKLFPNETAQVVIRNLETQRYWINENLLKITSAGKDVNLSVAIIAIIEKYIEARQNAFHSFIAECQKILELKGSDPATAKLFVADLLNQHVDVRILKL